MGTQTDPVKIMPVFYNGLGGGDTLSAGCEARGCQLDAVEVTLGGFQTEEESRDLGTLFQ